MQKNYHELERSQAVLAINLLRYPNLLRCGGMWGEKMGKRKKEK